MPAKGAFRFSLAGFPDDTGVKNVNGRAGAALGPVRFMEAFLKLRGEVHPPVQAALAGWELSEVTRDLSRTHQNGRDLTARQLEQLGMTARSRKCAHVAVGGGHDWVDPWFRAFQAVLGRRLRIGCINLDAHFDLRDPEPVMNSGAPFRRLIEDGILSPGRLIEFGIQNHCNAPELWEYARKKKIKTVPFEELREGRALSRFRACLRDLKKKADVILISLDLDVASLAYAPGVSAPQPEGLTAGEVFSILEAAGAEPRVLGLGVFELAPPLDVNDHTSRFAAQGVWKFLRKKMAQSGA